MIRSRLFWLAVAYPVFLAGAAWLTVSQESLTLFREGYIWLIVIIFPALVFLWLLRSRLNQPGFRAISALLAVTWAAGVAVTYLLLMSHVIMGT